MMSLIDQFIHISPVIQAISGAGILAVAILSLRWAIATFKQREEHQAACELPYYSMRIVTVHAPPEQLQSESFALDVPPEHLDVPPEQLRSASFALDPLLNDEIRRLQRWKSISKFGQEKISKQQVSTALLHCLGPGMISSAEVQYLVEIFDRPIAGQTP